MRSMKATLYDGKAVQVTEIPRPSAEAGTVVVRVCAAGICGSDLIWLRERDKPERVPGGHEVAGEIVEIGPGVEGWSVGDRIALDTICQGRGCGQCTYCVAGQHLHCPNKGSAEHSGGFAEYIQRKALGCHRIPDAVAWHEGALVEPLAVGVHGFRKGQLRGGETVLVLGSGTIGLTAIAAARALGAGTVLATARHQHQADMALKLGANVVLSPDDDELLQALSDATEGLGADVVVEAVGVGDTIRQAVEVCRPLGRVIVLGFFHKPVELDFGPALIGEKDLIFACCYSIIDQRHDFDVAIDIISSHRFPLQDLVTHTFPLEQAQQALQTAYDKSTGAIKVQLTS
jgi:2-desacetyl-2-hydroxyethyl bacteriochlorophyllide A dehydrogenase